jgi:patatin-like phospholipase domain-containing protein 1
MSAVGHVMQKYIKPEDDIVYAGISGGCFPALALAAGLDIDEMHNAVNIRIVREVNERRFGVWFVYNRHGKNALYDYLPKDTYKVVSGKLRVLTTILPSRETEIIDSWEDNWDLINTIFCSCYIPLTFGKGLWQTHRGKRRVDGGIGCYTGEVFWREDLDTFVMHRYR